MCVYVCVCVCHCDIPSHNLGHKTGHVAHMHGHMDGCGRYDVTLDTAINHTVLGWNTVPQALTVPGCSVVGASYCWDVSTESVALHTAEHVHARSYNTATPPPKVTLDTRPKCHRLALTYMEHGTCRLALIYRIHGGVPAHLRPHAAIRGLTNTCLRQYCATLERLPTYSHTTCLHASLPTHIVNTHATA